ncbi:putative nicotinate-nucleotide adenylyltransferase [Bacteroidia bacterium]|nr:putative nicotinate-nucleotide adenylyltransferase [Bacteroidia bacterium]
MKIGIFPGSFNPVHNGHLAMANYLAEYEGYDEIWFMITPQNPGKSRVDLLDQNIRLKLLEESIKGYSKFKINTMEWEMPQPCYTVNTLQKLRMTHPKDQIELIIGTDNWAMFHRWKDYQVIIKNFKILIYPRRGSDKVYLKYPTVRLAENAPKFGVSSTDIREAIKAGKDLRYYMPGNTYEQVVALDFFHPDPEGESTAEAESEATEMVAESKASAAAAKGEATETAATGE